MIIGDMEIRLRADIARLQRDMDDARRIAGGAIDGIRSAADRAKAALAGMAGGLSLAALGNQVIGAQREFDKLNASLVTATGSTAGAAAAFKSLQAFAATTPYSVANAVEAFIKMKNLGLDPSEKALRSYGNTAAAMGKGLDQMIEAVADAASGEFERLKEFGIKSSQSGDRVALTFRGVTKNIGNNADEIQAYLKKMGDTDFAGAMDARAATLDGAISNLADTWDAFLLKLSQSGIGDAAKSGVMLLADNLELLAGAVATLGAAKLASMLDAWIKKTYEEIAASAAARAATLASLEATVAETAAKISQLTATQAMIVVAREEAVAKLASSNSNIAAARTAITAAEAAGAQSFALHTVRLATAELAVAEAQRSAMLAELAVLGRQQASVSAQLTAALAAQAAAQAAVNGATGAGTAAAGLASRALGLLGGPIGAVVTVLGLAATAWMVWGNSAKEANEKVAKSTEETAAQTLDRLNEEIKKLKERKDLLDAKPEVKSASEGDQQALARLQADLKAIKASEGEYVGQTDNMRALLIRIVDRQIGEMLDSIKQKAQLTAEIAIAGDTTMLAIRQRLTGVSQEYLDEVGKLQAAHEKGLISQNEYTAAMSKLATDTFNGSEAGKSYAQSVDMQAAAIQRAAEAQGLRNQREQEHIQFLKSSGQADDETTIRSAAAAQIKELGNQIALQQRLMGVERQRQQTAEQLAQKQAEASGKIASLNIQIDNAKAKREEDLILLQQQRKQESDQLYGSGILAATAERDSLQAQVEAQFQYNQEIGLTAKQAAEVQAGRLASAAALKSEAAAALDAIDPGSKLADVYRAQAQAMIDLGEAKVRGAVKQDLFGKNIEDANALVDIMSALDDAAQSAAQGMAKSFGSVGEAIGGMTTALTGFERTQAAIAAQLAASMKDAGGDQTKIARANAMAADQSARAQVKSYGDMAGAAKGFFNENSAGYKVLGGIEKAYRAAEMAMALESMVKKIFFKETEVAANTTLNATKLTGEAVSSAASTGLAATEASAWGVTAVVKAIASMPFPLNLAAGAATLAAVVGIGAKLIGGLGGGSVSLSQQRQEAQGTGSVLGDSSAKSESIKRAIDLTAANSSTQINYLSAMTTALRSIESSISSFASQLVRTTDLSGSSVNLNTNNGGATTAATLGLTAGGAAVGGMAGAGLTAFTAAGAVGGPIGMIAGAVLGYLASKSSFVGKIATSIFGGKQSVEDTGITMSPTQLSEVLNSGAKLSQYTDVKTSGGWFSSDKHGTTTTDLGDAENAQITAVLKSMTDSIKIGAGLLGVEGDEFTKKLNSYVISLDVSLKDLKGDELEAAIESVFSKLGDDMAQFAIGGLGAFQKVGEGYLETLVRVASDYAKLDASLTSIGMTFGTTGLQSIAARESLIDLLGGIDEFQSKTASFADNFLTEAERLAPVQKYVSDELGKMNLGWVETRDQFKDVVLGLDLTTEAGRGVYATLMGLSEAFAATHAAIEDTSRSAQDIADERKDLQTQLDEATMSSVQLLEKQRAALDVSNRALFDQVQAAQKANAVLEERKGLQDQLDQLTLSSAELLARQRDALDASNQALFDQVQAAQAAKDALEAEKAVLNERKGLQDQLDQLTMSSAQLLEKQRSALDASNQALFDQVQAAQAAKDAAQVAAAAIEKQAQTQNSLLDLQGQIAELTGDKVAAAAVLQQQHAIALAALDPALRGATEKLWALQAAATATEKVKSDAAALLAGVDNAFSVLQNVVAREKEAVQSSIDAHTESVSKLQSLSQSLRSTLASMQSPDQQLAARVDGQAQIRAALAMARAGCALPDADSLKDALSAVQQDASGQFSSRTDYLRDLYKTQNDVGALADVSDDQLSVEQKALKAAQDQLKSLDSVVAQAQAQIDVLKGQSTTLLSIDQAIGGLTTAILAAQQNPVVSSASAINKSYQEALGRTADAAGLAFWQNQIAGGTSTSDVVGAITNSTEAQVRKMYQDLLGRPADSAGLSFFLQGGASMADIAAALKSSDEYKKLHVPGFANGGNFAGGIRMVGEIGPELEVTGASRIHSTQSLMDALRSPSDNSAVLAAAVDRLTVTVERQNVVIAKQGAALDQIQRNTKRQADTFEMVTEGGSAMRTKEETA